MLYEHFLHPDLIMEESLQETNGRCVFVALAKRMNEEERLIEGALEEVFDELYDRKEPPWCGKHFRDLGVTPAMLIRFAEKREMGCLALHGNIAYHRSYGERETVRSCFVGGRVIATCIPQQRGSTEFRCMTSTLPNRRLVRCLRVRYPLRLRTLKNGRDLPK